MYKDETYKHVKENARVENLSSSTERKEEETSRNYKLSGYFIRYERDSLRSGKMRYDYTHKTFRSGQKGVIFFFSFAVPPSATEGGNEREDNIKKKKKEHDKRLFHNPLWCYYYFFFALVRFFFIVIFCPTLSLIFRCQMNSVCSSTARFPRTVLSFSPNRF